MNGRSQRYSVRMFVVALSCVALYAILGGAPSFAQETPPPTQTPPPAPSPDEAAKEKGLREKPVAAGRNKEAVVQEALEAKRAEAAPSGMDLSTIGCEGCHECDQPTKEAPCLRICPRGVAQQIAEFSHETLPSDTVLLNAFPWEERRFMPVSFSHKLHADMAGMTGGCRVCHHHTTREQIHPGCKTCHPPVFGGAGAAPMRMPNLKGAYHRQCMGCHRDWSHNTKCTVCHPLKGDQAEPKDLTELPVSGDVAGHPPIENPEHIVHKTDYEPGPHVVFRHKEHVDRYGYTCERCHKGQNCSRCHELTAAEPEMPATGGVQAASEQRHRSCFPCHEDDACERCHTQTEKAEPQYFDHDVTGFSLKKHHGKLTCRDCHKRLFFTRKLEGACTFCHKDWKPGTFDHAATGQKLDENHTDLDCGECHQDDAFGRAPVCTGCHEEDEGIAFPDRRPGPLVQP